MKTMTCGQLGGPETCQQTFQADTFEQIGQQSRQHAMEMAQQQEPNHLQAMETMKQLMTNSQAMQDWMTQKQSEFDTLPQDQ